MNGSSIDTPDGTAPSEAAARGDQGPRRSLLASMVLLIMAGAMGRVAVIWWPHLEVGGDPGLGVAAVAAALTAAALGWLAVTILAVGLGGLPGWGGHLATVIAEAIAPRLARQVIAVALGLTGATGLAATGAAAATSAVAMVDHGGGARSPASDSLADEAAPSTPDPTPGSGQVSSEAKSEVVAMDLDPSWVPDRPPTASRSDPSLLSPPGDRRLPAAQDAAGHQLSPALEAAPGPRTATTSDEAVVVLAGDTLWSIAQRWLGPDADSVEIHDAWPRWYQANRATIGPDPHLILPGTRLTPPAAQQLPSGAGR